MMTKDDVKALTAVLAGLAGLATAVGSCNQAAQERFKAENKIYTVLAAGQKQQGSDLAELHNQITELRGYLQALRDRIPPELPSALPSVSPALPHLVPLLRPLHALGPLPSPAPEALPELPSASPAPVQRPLPRFEDLTAPP